MEKTCSKCKQSKATSEFHKDRTNKDDLQYQCKDCRMQYKPTPEKSRERTRRWRIRNIDQHAKNVRKWKIAHPERVLEVNKKWRADNPERDKEIRRRGRHKRRSLLKDPLPREFKLLDHCELCFSTEDLSLDHDIPVSRDGTNDLSNLHTVCKRHNSEKSNKTYKEYIRYVLEKEWLNDY